MATLGIITCEILELEFAYVLGHDDQVEIVTVVEDIYSMGLIESLERDYKRTPRRIPIVKGFSSSCPESLEVVVRVLELSLHSRKRRLQEGLVTAAKELGRYVDAIVLGYGLCGNALMNHQELFSSAGVPVIMPMDKDHPIDDCVGLIIGVRDIYYGEQRKIAGTFFMIPG